jgi:hypothetical protein
MVARGPTRQAIAMKKTWSTALDDALVARIIQASDQRNITQAQLAQEALSAALAVALVDLLPKNAALVVGHRRELLCAADIPAVTMLLDRANQDSPERGMRAGAKVFPGSGTQLMPGGQPEQVIKGDLVAIGSPRVNEIAAAIQELCPPHYAFTECFCPDDPRWGHEPDRWHITSACLGGHRHRIWCGREQHTLDSLFEDWGVVRYEPNPLSPGEGRVLSLMGLGAIGTYDSVRAACSPEFLEEIRAELAVPAGEVLPWFECIIGVRVVDGILGPPRPYRNSVKRIVPRGAKSCLVA